jgi:hypothetical protein
LNSRSLAGFARLVVFHDGLALRDKASRALENRE